MRRCRKVSLIVLVCTTAACTLIATTPHFTCRCPDGRVKAFCWALWMTSAKCCCDGNSCCSTENSRAGSNPDGKEPSETCCGGKNEDTFPEPVHGDSGGQPQGPRQSLPENAVSQSCCQKTLAQAEVFSLKHGELKIAEAAPAPFIHVNLSCFSTATACVSVWQACRMPPPTDLVVTLQHLVI